MPSHSTQSGLTGAVCIVTERIVLPKTVVVDLFPTRPFVLNGPEFGVF